MWYSKSFENIVLVYYKTMFVLDKETFQQVGETITLQDTITDVSSIIEDKINKRIYFPFEKTVQIYFISTGSQSYEDFQIRKEQIALQFNNTKRHLDLIDDLEKMGEDEEDKIEDNLEENNWFEENIDNNPWFNDVYSDNSEFIYSWGKNNSKWLQIDKRFSKLPIQQLAGNLTIMDMKIDGDYLYVLVKEIGILAFNNKTLIQHRCVTVKNGMKFAVLNSTIVLVTKESSGPTLLELNYYVLIGDSKAKWHFNRAIYYLTKIQKITMDNVRAYIIGKNVHFIYKHGIYIDFVKHEENIFFEFIDKGARDISFIPDKVVEDQIVDTEEEFGYNAWYTLTKYGVNVYVLEKASPKITCQTGLSSSDQPEVKFIKNKSTFDFRLTFYRANCFEKQLQSKDEQFFLACKTKSTIRMIFTEDLADEQFSDMDTKEAFEWGALLGVVLIISIVFACLGICWCTQVDNQKKTKNLDELDELA